ncbi:MAG TPA: hypothetical protein VKU19_32130 [Bryobacteraceae bacterium]|nr:hypothetical protein [Bryobacteraceae bacterium]
MNQSVVQGFSAFDPQAGVDRAAGARLCYFPTDSSTLILQHKDWINRFFLPKIRQYPNAWIDVIGSASTRGNAVHNMQLGQRRAEEVRNYIRMQYPGLNINRVYSEGATEPANTFRYDGSNNDGFWRAVLIRWYGLPDLPPTPYIPPPPDDPSLRILVRKAPPGCWCIVGVNTFGIPLKAGVAAGKVDITLLNDKGEKWVLHGYGGGLGAGPNIGPEIAEKGLKIVLKSLKEIGTHAGDLTNISDKLSKMNITGPSDTSGGVFRRFTWKADLTIKDITAAGFFTIASGETHIVAAGLDAGVVFFGNFDALDMFKTPWGFFVGLGLGTMKAALGVSAIVYKLTSYELQK